MVGLMTIMPSLRLVTNTPKGTIVLKRLNEMTIPELQAARLAAVDANDSERVELIGHYIAARYAGHTC